MADKKSKKLAVRLKENIEKLQNSDLNVEVATQQNMRLWDDQDKKDGDIDVQLQAQGMPIAIEENVMRDPVIEKIEGCLEVTNDALILSNEKKNMRRN